jgi:hypothetical protein
MRKGSSGGLSYERLPLFDLALSLRLFTRLRVVTRSRSGGVTVASFFAVIPAYSGIQTGPRIKSGVTNDRQEAGPTINYRMLWLLIFHGHGTLPSSFLLFNEFLQTELLDSIAYLSESYAQFLGRVRLNPIVAVQRV